ncbi:alpha/beta hydrolase [Mycolicibacterium fortuitum]
MAATIPTTRSDFVSAAQRCAAWLTLPDGPGPHPAVVLAHGLGATHEMMLAQYEQHFAASGIATLAFDYLHTGASEGAPRQRFSIPGQCRDLHAALNHLRAHPDIDATRIGLWGTSLGGMNVLRVAAERADIAAAVVQCRSCMGVRRRGPWARELSCGWPRPSVPTRCAHCGGALGTTSRSSDRPAVEPWLPCPARSPAGIRRFRRAAASTTGSPQQTWRGWCWRPGCAMRGGFRHRCWCACATGKI